jgi:S1-C subfamily serine protease
MKNKFTAQVVARTLALSAIAVAMGYANPTYGNLQQMLAPHLKSDTDQNAGGSVQFKTVQPVPNIEQVSSPGTLPVRLVSSPALESFPVGRIARQLTVRIISDSGVGSGVIVGRQGGTYTVLTCEHVLDNATDDRFTILTPDGLEHQAQWQRSERFEDADLAIIQFTSNRAYRVAKLRDFRDLSIGDSVYASGFPNWISVQNQLHDTRQWGLRAFQLTTGSVGMVPEQPLAQGYQLGYTNEIKGGMSGGPVLDQYGQLVGINGRMKYPLLGIQAFVFADKSLPSEELFRKMEALSWAIPITFYQKTFNQGF